MRQYCQTFLILRNEGKSCLFYAEMKKSKLVIDYEFDFELVGLISSAKGYKLAWELNQVLGIHLVKQPDLVVGFKNNEEKSFSFYDYQTQFNRLKMFKNKPSDADGGKYFLIPEFPHYDFIILADMEEKYSSHQLIQILRTIRSIELIALIPVDGLKSKLNFVF